MTPLTCATCRFMAAAREERYDSEADETRETVLHTCVRIIHGNRETFNVEPTAVQPAMVVDGSGYSARLLVLPTFGCNLHEPKP